MLQGCGYGLQWKGAFLAESALRNSTVAFEECSTAQSRTGRRKQINFRAVKQIQLQWIWSIPSLSSHSRVPLTWAFVHLLCFGLCGYQRLSAAVGGTPAPQRANLEQTLGEDLEMEQAGFRTSLGFDSCPLVGVVLPLILPDVPVHRWHCEWHPWPLVYKNPYEAIASSGLVY